MKPLAILFFPFLLLAGLGLAGCHNPPSSQEVLAGAIRQIEESRSIRYEYEALWDNRFNETAYADSARVIYSKMDGTVHGFGFYANTYEREYLFDGAAYKEIWHRDNTLVRHDPEAVMGDSAYFSDKMFFAYTPFELAREKAFDRILDTIIGQKEFFIYAKKQENPSAGDTTRMVRSERLYYVEKTSKAVERIQSIIVIGKDTLQVIDCWFTAIQFDEQAYDLSSMERPGLLEYREVSIHSLDAERNAKQIAAGERLENRFYPDIQGRKAPLFGNPDKQSVVLFSFIGCGGCEYALRELKEGGYKIRAGLDLFYSSPVDGEAVLRPYLRKKAFPFVAFSKESGMNEDFSVYAFPTFVLIGSDGVVGRVVSGFGEEARELLFE